MKVRTWDELNKSEQRNAIEVQRVHILMDLRGHASSALHNRDRHPVAILDEAEKYRRYFGYTARRPKIHENITSNKMIMDYVEAQSLKDCKTFQYCEEIPDTIKDWDLSDD